MEATIAELMTIKEIAAEYGVHVMTISDICRNNGLVPKKVPRSGNAKGYDLADRAVIRRALSLPAEQ